MIFALADDFRTLVQNPKPSWPEKATFVSASPNFSSDVSRLIASSG